MSSKTILTLYFAMQSLAIVAWWSLLWMAPKTIQLFQPRDWPNEILLSFCLPDLALLTIGSSAAAWAIHNDHRHAKLILWFLNGAAWYSTLYCLSVSFRTDQAWLASSCMVAMSGLTLAMATILGNQQQSLAAIRETPMQPILAFGWTLLQIPIFWGTFLWILPKGVLEAESIVGMPHFDHPYQVPWSLGLFSAASVLGLWSAASMALHGRGTPLPTATAPLLVIQGPYRFVRNPMATAGIIQGLAIGWYFGSFGILLYSLLGAHIWHWFVRPVEEKDLTSRFGEAYRDYQASVGLWVPKLFRKPIH